MTHRSSLLVTVLMPALFATTVVDKAAAQDDAASLAAQTDQVFAHLDKPDSPGCTCAVMRDGEVVYSRAFGMANLELGVPLTPESVFIVGSVSKLRWNRIDTLAMIPWRIHHPRLADLVLLDANPLEDIKNTQLSSSTAMTNHLPQREAASRAYCYRIG